MFIKELPKIFLSVSLLFFMINSSSAISGYVESMALGSKPKYTANFEHFEYTDPGAKVGGELRMASMGTFDKVNPFSLRGIVATGVSDLIFEPLAIFSLDESMTMYGLLAKEMKLGEDKLSISFRLDPRAKFSNGKPVLAKDVVFSYETLIFGDGVNPFFKNYWADIKGVSIVSKREVKFTFRKKNRELHFIIASLPIFSEEWGKERESFADIVTDNPIASGPYKIKKIELGKGIWFEKREEYWAKNHPVRKNQFNFSTISFRYYKDAFARLEAFKAGEFDFIHENTSKIWARSYKGKSFTSGEKIKEELKNSNPAGMQGYIFNTRKTKFSDFRVRKAIYLAMDFEWMNRQLFYGQYKRSYSFFTNTAMSAVGFPSESEIKLLAELVKESDATFNPGLLDVVPLPPSNLEKNALRNNLKRARLLLEEAGWFVKNGRLQNDQGDIFEFEILLDTRGWERVVAPFARNLTKLGIFLKTRVTDLSLYKQRIDNFDYDMLVHWYLSGQNPGNELFNRYSSISADQKASRNYIGVKDPLVDLLIARIIKADDRRELVTASRLLDRVLLNEYYVIPHWHNTVHRVSYDSRISRPKTLPLYYGSEIWAFSTWWWGESQR
tara:strand:- start:1422 stop:3257 length:1836 start_codon:yes stop_codon:yes gene_type:complete